MREIGVLTHLTPHEGLAWLSLRPHPSPNNSTTSHLLRQQPVLPLVDLLPESIPGLIGPSSEPISTPLVTHGMFLSHIFDAVGSCHAAGRTSARELGESVVDFEMRGRHAERFREAPDERCGSPTRHSDLDAVQRRNARKIGWEKPARPDLWCVRCLVWSVVRDSRSSSTR